MSKEQLIGFGLDLEGPMVNLETDGHHAAYLRAASEVGVSMVIGEALERLPHLVGGPGDETAREIWELSNRRLSPDEIYRRKQGLFKEWFKEVKKIPTRQGLFEFLEEARRRGTPMVIGTATPPEAAMDYVSRSGLADFFDRSRIVLAEDVGGKTKPAPDIYLATARIMQIDPRDQLVVEDSPRGVEAGVAARSIVIGLPVYFLPATIKPLEAAGARIVYRGWKEVDLNFLLRGGLPSTRDHNRP